MSTEQPPKPFCNRQAAANTRLNRLRKSILAAAKDQGTPQNLLARMIVAQSERSGGDVVDELAKWFQAEAKR